MNNDWSTMAVTMKKVILFLWIGIAGVVQAAISLDLTSESDGIKVVHAYSGSPDQQGILETYSLVLPAHEKATYFRGPWWPYGGNRVSGQVLTAPQALEGGLFLVLKLKAGDYLAVLPLAGDQAWAWLAPDGQAFRLKLGTKGSAAVKGDLPLVCWARSDSPYDAVHQVWKQARTCEPMASNMKLREEKRYPEMFEYLGWCSWEGYFKDINEDKLVSEFKGLEKSEVPIRYFLVDDGHFDKSSIGPHQGKFPNGYKPLTDLRSDDGIRWVGMWYALLGENKAMPVGTPPAILDSMTQMHNGRMIAKPDAESIEIFLDYMLSFSERDDIDFVKVDFSGTLLPAYAGSPQELPLKGFPETTEHAIANPSAATTTFAQLYQKVVDRKFDGLMNCNWQVPHFIFNSGESVVGRCSSDYKKGSLDRAKAHLYESYSASLWIGQTQWGDHDMFHSSDVVSGRLMAVSKAMSGGPVYLSDRHEEIVPEMVMPLCYEDGLLPRPLAPAVPLVEDIFSNVSEKRLYRTVAPLANDSAAFVLYNLYGDASADDEAISGRISPADYAAASGMIQPYSGEWAIPSEGLLVYDHYKKSAEKLGDAYEVSISGFDDRLLQVSPVRKGWSVIGRTDKYLSAATVKVLSVSEHELKLKLHEVGPFAVWLEHGMPVAEGVVFEDKGHGLFEADVSVRDESAIIVIRKQ